MIVMQSKSIKIQNRARHLLMLNSKNRKFRFKTKTVYNNPIEIKSIFHTKTIMNDIASSRLIGSQKLRIISDNMRRPYLRHNLGTKI